MNRKLKGIIFIILSAFFFASMSAFVRLSGDLPSIQKSFFRNLIALIFAGIILLRNKEDFKFNKNNLIFLILRSTFGTIGIIGNFYAIDHLILSDASMIAKLAPFFVIIFSFIFLKEKVNLIQILAVIIAFIGSLFVIKPEFGSSLNLGAISALIGSMGAGAAYTTLRYLKQRGEKSAFIIFFFSAFSCVVTLPYIIFNYEPMSMYQVLMLLISGLCASGGQFCVTNAYTYAPAKEISVYDYSQVLFASVFGLLFFSDIPDRYSILGYIIIFSISLIMFLYNIKVIDKKLTK